MLRPLTASLFPYTTLFRSLGGAAVWAATGGMQNIMDIVSTTTAPTNVGGDPIPAGSMISPVGTFGAGALFSIFISNSLGAPVSPHWVTRMLAPKNIKVAILQVMGSIFVLTLIFAPLV